MILYVARRTWFSWLFLAWLGACRLWLATWPMEMEVLTYLWCLIAGASGMGAYRDWCEEQSVPEWVLRAFTRKVPLVMRPQAPEGRDV